MAKRIALVLLPWLLSVPALALSLSMALGGALDFSGRWSALTGSAQGDPSTGNYLELASIAVFTVCVPAAWLGLARMSVAWCAQHRLHRAWPLSGTALAVLGLLAFGAMLGPMGLMMGLLWASPGIVRAVLLCGFHLGGQAPAPS